MPKSRLRDPIPIDNSKLPVSRLYQKESVEMENEKKELTQEEDPKPLTEEEFAEYQDKDVRSTKKVLRFFKAIWEAINFFS